ncbi:MAG: hypothetical protein R3D02_13070 [Hyphomicrobiales bacterium]
MTRNGNVTSKSSLPARILFGFYILVVAAGLAVSLIMAARILTILGVRKNPPPVEATANDAAPGRPGPAAMPDEANGNDAGDFTDVWTVRPKRVDPAAQSYRRLEPPPRNEPFPAILSVPMSVRVLDNARFTMNGKTWRIDGVEPDRQNRICTNALGLRWACGVRARVFLRNLIAGSTYRCRLSEARDGEQPVDCQITAGTTIAMRILGAGWGEPESTASDELQAIHAEAAARHFGFWREN